MQKTPMMSESEPYTSKNMFTVGDSSLASSFTGACWVLQAFSESEGVCVCSSNGDWEGQAGSCCASPCGYAATKSYMAKI